MGHSYEYNLPEFSCDNWLQIVFADEKDYYYTSSLLRLELNQYLWLSLRQNHDAVWFVTVKMKEKTAKVRHYKDSVNDLEIAKLKNFWGAKKAFDWIMEQLDQKDEKKRQAFVLDQDSFKILFEDRKLTDENKNRLKNNTLILLLPPSVDKTKELLLGSQAFDNLDAKFVIKNLRESQAENKDIYLTLCNRCKDVCLFLNEFTTDRMKWMLYYSLMSHPEREVDSNTLKCMAAYLTEYLNNRCLRWSEEDRFFDEEDRSFDPAGVRYRDIEQRLATKEVWNTLEQRVCEILSTYEGDVKDERDVRKALKQYMERKNISYGRKRIYMKQPTTSTIMSYYLDLDRYNKNIAMSSIPENLRKIVLEAYEEIYQLVYTTVNCQENTECKKTLDDLLSQLNNHQREPEIYFRYLLCIGKCMSWIYESNNEQLQSRADLLKGYMKVILNVFENNWDDDDGKRQEIREEVKKLKLDECVWAREWDEDKIRKKNQGMWKVDTRKFRKS